MTFEDLVMVCISDYAGQVRGKGFPASELPLRLERGVGLAPTNLMITAFGEIGNSPWGSRGEVLMMPDANTEVILDLAPDLPVERFLLADIVELDGTPWPCCPRAWLRRGLRQLETETDLKLRAAFEHEFHYSGAAKRLGDAYLLDSVRPLGRFPGTLLAQMRRNGIQPDTFLPEYGPGQFEVTCKPVIGLAAADQAVQLREITRAVARSSGHKATFAPVMAAGAVGNGVHIHFSLLDDAGRSVCRDPDAPHEIAATAGHFVAGILRHMPAIVALTAPSVVSYERLQPNRWSATYNNLGISDREAGVRLSPISALAGEAASEALHFEYRAADAAASPYIALGALVWAGLQGIRDRAPLPEPTLDDPANFSAKELQRHSLTRLPQSLPEALTQLEASAEVRAWMGDDFRAAYLMHKRSEIAFVEDLSPEEQVQRYADAY